MLNSTLCSQIRRDIQHGVWHAGQAITQQQLADFYQVSRIPVRDAIALLATEGWLQQKGKAGYQVMQLTATQALELAEIRAELEPLALRLALPQLTHAVLGAAKDQLQRLQQAEDVSSWQLGQLNWQFHLTLYQPCQRPQLLQLLHQLHEKAAMYLGFQHQQLAYAATSDLQHEQLLELLHARQHDEALRLLREHILVAGQQLAHHFSQLEAAATTEPQ